MAQNLEVDDDYSKYAPSAEYTSTAGRSIFRNKKFTKKRHESKSRRTDHSQDATNVCGSDEDYPQASSSKQAELRLQGSLPKILSSINHTIQKMTIKDTNTPNSNCGNTPSTIPEGRATTFKVEAEGAAVGEAGSAGIGWRDAGIGGSTTNLEVDESGQQHRHYNSNNSSSCNLHAQPQGKRRRHRRKQQYKRMAVDAHTQNEKACLQLKLPTSNSSEDSGIGKRKRNIIVPADGSGVCSPMGVARVSVPVPVVLHSGSASSHGHSTMDSMSDKRLPWVMEPDNDDAVMMDCEELESNSNTRVITAGSEGILGTEEESGESDTQNDDIESLSDNNQDADDEESDYYNNDSSTTSLSESSFTVLNSSKKFIPVHSREIRSGRRRLKDNYLGSIENEEVSKFIQTPSDTVLKVFPASERERLDFMSIANRYSLSLEEGREQEDQRIWVQFTKTPKTTSTQRKNDLIKAAIGDRFTESSSHAVFLDSFVNEEEECNDVSDGCAISGNGAGVGNNLVRGAVFPNQLVNSKRIKKGS